MSFETFRVGPRLFRRPTGVELPARIRTELAALEGEYRDLHNDQWQARLNALRADGLRLEGDEKLEFVAAWTDLIQRTENDQPDFRTGSWWGNEPPPA